MVMAKRTDPQFKIRLPEDLKKYIVDIAEHNSRSANSEIVNRLERTRRQDEQEKAA